MRKGGYQVGIAIVLLSGCAPATNNPVPVASSQTIGSSLDGLSGKKLSIKGVLEGHWIRQRSGKIYGNSSKGTQPLSIKYGARSLPVIGVNEELEKVLVDHAGQNVQIEGTIVVAESAGRGELGGQAGYRGPIPDHKIYFINVTGCKPVNADTP